MRAQTARRFTSTLVVLALLAPALAQALPFHVKTLDTSGLGAQTGEPASWIEMIWQEFIRLWSGSTVSGVGPGLDPLGNPTTPSSGASPGAGAGPGLDPLGDPR